MRPASTRRERCDLHHHRDCDDHDALHGRAGDRRRQLARAQASPAEAGGRGCVRGRFAVHHPRLRRARRREWTQEEAIVTVARAVRGRDGFAAVNPQVSGGDHTSASTRRTTPTGAARTSTSRHRAGAGPTTPAVPKHAHRRTISDHGRQGDRTRTSADSSSRSDSTSSRISARAHACASRASARPKAAFRSGSPTCVPDVWLEFINECDGGALIHREKLVRGASTGGIITWTAAAPFTVDIPAATSRL